LRRGTDSHGLNYLSAEQGKRGNYTVSVNLAIALSLAACATALAGCAPTSYLIVSEDNYYTFDRPFTDAAAEAVRKDAEKRCRERARVAIKINDTCSLTRCTTNYECVTKAEEEKFRL
jgi:hypothetical protein